jgi:hypothetical protein
MGSSWKLAGMGMVKKLPHKFLQGYEEGFVSL